MITRVIKHYRDRIRELRAINEAHRELNGRLRKENKELRAEIERLRAEKPDARMNGGKGEK